ncbi:hypothetical protein [Pedobacter boryungensis]|uniref:Secreted protein n=1 Tax=Pedobacter boryungensis TaxID=869962 RepID=A0ABX2D8R2_9SPHI|nr:hypothetical protein [Pedobacter boryungensis]NQX30360.1 hypothetical protein [Pedobacter boryungensis]
MRFLRSLFILTLFTLLSNTSFATTVSGYGCRIGDVVFTQYLGSTYFWGTTYKVYNRNGQVYSVDYSPGQQCNYIESNNIYDQGRQCWVNTYVNPMNNQDGASYGTYVYYSVDICNVNLPLDDYVWIMVLVAGGVGAYVISKKRMIFPTQ